MRSSTMRERSSPTGMTARTLPAALCSPSMSCAIAPAVTLSAVVSGARATTSRSRSFTSRSSGAPPATYSPDCCRRSATMPSKGARTDARFTSRRARSRATRACSTSCSAMRSRDSGLVQLALRHHVAQRLQPRALRGQQRELRFEPLERGIVVTQGEREALGVDARDGRAALHRRAGLGDPGEQCRRLRWRCARRCG